MKTKFKPDGYNEDDLAYGLYFKSDGDISTQYLIQFKVFTFELNGSVIIFETSEVLDNYFNTDELTNGSIIAVPVDDIGIVAKIDLWPKYFYIDYFNTCRQLYYDESKYYSSKSKTDSVISMAECINFAIEHGLKHFNIKPR